MLSSFSSCWNWILCDCHFVVLDIIRQEEHTLCINRLCSKTNTESIFCFFTCLFQDRVLETNKWKQGNGLLVFSGWKVRDNQLSNSFYTASLELGGGFCLVFFYCCFNRRRSMQNTFVDLWAYCTSALVGPRSVLLRTSSNLSSV